MCGILFTNDQRVDEDSFQKAILKIQRRGPDACGSKHFGMVKLGHTRLKIQDLEDASNQPFMCPQNRYCLIFNGEIYNFKELAKEYKLGTKTHSDTEVLLLLYIKFKQKCLDLLNGMFAFVIFDSLTGEIFAARDRLGIKPLYVVETPSSISFASEISAIRELGICSNQLDEIGVRQYRKMRTFFRGHTLYKDIRMMEAGTYYDSGTFKHYWQFSINEQPPPSDEELYDLLNSAVAYRCISDVPVGSFLSGGLDSSIITALASKEHSWCVGYDEDNEFTFAESVAEHISTVHQSVKIEFPEFRPLALEMIAERQEPLSVPNEVLLYKLSKIVKEKNTVVLSGEGADELMFGYDRIFRWANQYNWNIQEFDKYYCYGTHKDDDIIDYVMQPYLKYKENLDIIASFFQSAHLHGLLRRLDFTTMAYGLEARVPFVDHRLIERMSGVDFKYRMADGEVKAPFKRIFGHLLPTQICARKKIGFPVPLDQILSVKDKKQSMDAWLDFNLSTINEALV